MDEILRLVRTPGETAAGMTTAEEEVAAIRRGMATCQRPGDRDTAETCRALSRRSMDRVSVPRGKGKLTDCRLGRTYDPDENVEVTFEDIVNVNRYANDRSYVMVGTQMRWMHLGIPMGDPLSVAKANAVAFVAERAAKLKWRAEVKMEGDRGVDIRGRGEERDLTYSYIDDIHLRVAYNPAQDTGKGM